MRNERKKTVGEWKEAKVHMKTSYENCQHSNMSNPIKLLKSYILQCEGSLCKVNVSVSKWV